MVPNGWVRCGGTATREKERRGSRPHHRHTAETKLRPPPEPSSPPSTPHPTPPHPLYIYNTPHKRTRCATLALSAPFLLSLCCLSAPPLRAPPTPPVPVVRGVLPAPALPQPGQTVAQPAAGGGHARVHARTPGQGVEGGGGRGWLGRDGGVEGRGARVTSSTVDAGS